MTTFTYPPPQKWSGYGLTGLTMNSGPEVYIFYILKTHVYIPSNIFISLSWRPTICERFLFDRTIFSLNEESLAVRNIVH